jgi:hypothetical protein
VADVDVVSNPPTSKVARNQFVRYSYLAEVGTRWRSWLRLQAVRSAVRFPMVSLELFIDIILPASLWS